MEFGKKPGPSQKATSTPGPAMPFAEGESSIDVDAVSIHLSEADNRDALDEKNE